MVLTQLDDCVRYHLRCLRTILQLKVAGQEARGVAAIEGLADKEAAVCCRTAPGSWLPTLAGLAQASACPARTHLPETLQRVRVYKMDGGCAPLQGANV